MCYNKLFIYITICMYMYIYIVTVCRREGVQGLSRENGGEGSESKEGMHVRDKMGAFESFSM